MPVPTLRSINQTRIIGALLLAALILSGCGLAMNTEDRLDRAAKALDAGEFRAAIIDAKDVLAIRPRAPAFP